MRAAHNQGFTLLELMIAMTIGLFLAGALITVVQTNKTVFSNQNNLEQMQDGQRMAMTMMTDVIQSAGYFPAPQTNTLGGTLLASGAFANSQSITGQYLASALGDTISVRYMTAPQDGILNCSGLSNTNAVGGANILYVNTFAVVPGAPAGQPNQLQCTDQNGATYNLVSGVTNLSVLYGVKTNAGATGNNVDTYMNATQVTAGLYWQSVISVQISLTFTNPLYIRPNLGQPQTITIQRVVDVMNQTGPST
jgi:type IV pilus assembly protein PilW